MSCRENYDNCLNADNPEYQEKQKAIRKWIQCTKESPQGTKDDSCKEQLMSVPTVQKDKVLLAFPPFNTFRVNTSSSTSNSTEKKIFKWKDNKGVIHVTNDYERYHPNIGTRFR